MQRVWLTRCGVVGSVALDWALRHHSVADGPSNPLNMTPTELGVYGGSVLAGVGLSRLVGGGGLAVLGITHYMLQEGFIKFEERKLRERAIRAGSVLPGKDSSISDSVSVMLWSSYEWARNVDKNFSKETQEVMSNNKDKMMQALVIGALLGLITRPRFR